MAARSQRLRELQGPLLPAKDPVEESDDRLAVEAEEDEEPEFVDAEELCSGGLKAGSLPGSVRVVIPDENTQERCEVSGRFPLTGPWWRVKVQVKPVGSRNYQVQGFPSYFLQSDMSPPHQKNICSLFLKDCNVPSDTINNFLVWVNKTSSYKDLNFENLTETLRTFYKEIKRNGKKQSTQTEWEESQLDGDEMCLPVENTIPFVSVMTALQFPKVMEFLPILLPRHFKKLLSSDSKEVLKKIEEILDTHPWKLGFKKVTYRELKLLRCEASWAAFCQCKSLLQLMTNLEKNGLIVYSKLKQLCREHGHTYVEEKDLSYQLSGCMFIPEVWESLKFLKDIGVVTYKQGRVFLYELYQAETGIASSVGNLMMRPPWFLHVNVKKVLASILTKNPENSGSDNTSNECKPDDDILNGSKPDDTLNDSEPDDTRLEISTDILNTQDGGDYIWDKGENEDNAAISEDQLDPDQVAALEMICSNAVTVISGKGGCGKTTIVSRLFKHIEQLEESEVKKACEDFERDQDESEEWITFTDQSLLKAGKAIDVLLTAPTGKAAGLLREKTGFSAYTLCQVNYSFYFWDQKTNKSSPWKFSSVRVLVVDEGSLVSVAVFKCVLNLLLEHSKLSKLIILGDIRQLPSIEPGNLLEDLFETFKSRNCAIELKTNHRAESELIVDNATRISERQFPKFDAELNISDEPTVPVSLQDKTFIFVRLPEEEDSGSQLSKNNHHPHLYSAVRTLLKENDLRCAETSQFIAFRRQDCDVINACCCKHYTGHLIKDHQNRFIFGVGDKICCTKNAYLSDLLPGNSFNGQQNNELEVRGEDFSVTPHGAATNKQDFESGTRLCNGEIFFITNDITDVTSGRKRYLTINNMAGLEVKVDFGKLMKHCRIRHAWARTIHTFQGSEEQTVVYAVGKAGRQNWQHVYTAVSRGRCRVYVIAEESHLRAAVLKNKVHRKTRLKHFLQNELSPSCVSPAGSASPSQRTEDRREPSTQLSATPPPVGTADGVANGVLRSQASAAGDKADFCGGWKSPPSDEADTDEDPSRSRGFKRTCAVNEAESPTKILMMEGSSPQVSSKLQNLRLNRLTPRQLFKPANNQET